MWHSPVGPKVKAQDNVNLLDKNWILSFHVLYVCATGTTARFVCVCVCVCVFKHFFSVYKKQMQLVVELKDFVSISLSSLYVYLFSPPSTW